MAGGPPVGNDTDPFTFEGLEDLLDHLAEIQGNLPLVWKPWERRRLHAWARWVNRQIPPRLALALTAADAPVAPEPPPLYAESALRTAPDAAWRAAWRAGWCTGWVAAVEHPDWAKEHLQRRRGPLQPSDAGR